MSVEHKERENKFVYILEGGKEAYLLYRTEGEVALNLYSTFVPPEGRGLGIAGKLTAAAIKYAQQNNFKIIPACSYVEKYFEKRPELGSLKK